MTQWWDILLKYEMVASWGAGVEQIGSNERRRMGGAEGGGESAKGREGSPVLPVLPSFSPAGSTSVELEGLPFSQKAFHPLRLHHSTPTAP